MLYKKSNTSCISFPLGGIGSGCIGLCGNGALADWEIFNRPNKGSYNGISHFAVRAEEVDGGVIDVRALQGDLAPHYMGNYTADQRYAGFGFGPDAGTLCNLPHFRKHTFDGTYPTCRLEFDGEKFPARCALTAWSVMIPGESLPSSLPAAFFEVELENNTERPLIYTAVGVLSNPWSGFVAGCSNSGGDCRVTCLDGAGRAISPSPWMPRDAPSQDRPISTADTGVIPWKSISVTSWQAAIFRSAHTHRPRNLRKTAPCWRHASPWPPAKRKPPASSSHGASPNGT